MTDFVVPNASALGDRILVFDNAGGDRVAAQRTMWNLAEAARGVAGVVECVLGMNNLTIVIDPLRTSLEDVRDALERPIATPQTAERLVTIHVRYDGDDLDAVAHAANMTTHDVIELHASREYVAYFLGFQPGFAYLGDIDERIRMPRRASPRARVPAGSVAIADALTAVYPFASPGGWHVIGRTDETMFDVARAEPSLLRPRDRVRFVPV